MESPTHVGNTHGVLRRGSAPAVHPHACGEYHGTIEPVGISYGSSPRVWGIPFQHALAQIVDRFIPTRVGNTRRSSSGRAAAPVHPHACGEYGRQKNVRIPFCGSSPRVWGIRQKTRNQAVGLRFIPTRVGNTSFLPSHDGRTAVHPHACGEYTMIPESASCKSGSSPRVWGILAAGRQMNKAERFIPTRVGNTPVIGPAMYIFTVHPHACGEYGGGGFNQALSDGSSPRVWGILHGLRVGPQPRRFIPTRVGNTVTESTSVSAFPVHPHACGEYTIGGSNGT